MPTNTQKLTPAGQSPVLALAHGSLLSWEPREGQEDFELRGFLTHRPENTLFIIEIAPGEDEVLLTGALIPDDEESETWEGLGNAKAAAEQYLRDWLLNVAAPLLANTRICVPEPHE
jgi:hypothetical protein